MNILKLDGLQLPVSALETVGLNCKNLLEIGLSKCHGVTDEGISQLVEGCRDLLTIDLTCCSSLTDKSLFSIAASCRGVKCLRLESCVLISEKGLDQVATCCTDLKEIDLTDCNVNDNGMVAIFDIICTDLFICFSLFLIHRWTNIFYYMEQELANTHENTHKKPSRIFVLY